MASISLSRVESDNPLLNALSVVPGVLLLAGIEYAGKILERSLNIYAKSHHWTFPNIEYVLWAIYRLGDIQHRRRAETVSTRCCHL